MRIVCRSPILEYACGYVCVCVFEESPVSKGYVLHEVLRVVANPIVLMSLEKEAPESIVSTPVHGHEGKAL
jgi:hypothetical protein